MMTEIDIERVMTADSRQIENMIEEDDYDIDDADEAELISFLNVESLDEIALDEFDEHQLLRLTRRHPSPPRSPCVSTYPP